MACALIFLTSCPWNKIHLSCLFPLSRASSCSPLTLSHSVHPFLSHLTDTLCPPPQVRATLSCLYPSWIPSFALPLPLSPDSGSFYCSFTPPSPPIQTPVQHIKSSKLIQGYSRWTDNRWEKLTAIWFTAGLEQNSSSSSKCHYGIKRLRGQKWSQSGFRMLRRVGFVLHTPSSPETSWAAGMGMGEPGVACLCSLCQHLACDASQPGPRHAGKWSTDSRVFKALVLLWRKIQWVSLSETFMEWITLDLAHL